MTDKEEEDDEEFPGFTNVQERFEIFLLRYHDTTLHAAISEVHAGLDEWVQSAQLLQLRLLIPLDPDNPVVSSETYRCLQRLASNAAIEVRCKRDQVANCCVAPGQATVFWTGRMRLVVQVHEETTFDLTVPGLGFETTDLELVANVNTFFIDAWANATPLESISVQASDD